MVLIHADTKKLPTLRAGDDDPYRLDGPESRPGCRWVGNEEALGATAPIAEHKVANQIRESRSPVDHAAHDRRGFASMRIFEDRIGQARGGTVRDRLVPLLCVEARSAFADGPTIVAPRDDKISFKVRAGAKETHPWQWHDAWLGGDGENEDGQRRPGMTSRWNRGKDLSWEPLRPERVCEVAYDHLQGDRFRHGTTFVRWRLDKRPEDCRYDQLEETAAFELAKIFGS